MAVLANTKSAAFGGNEFTFDGHMRDVQIQIELMNKKENVSLWLSSSSSKMLEN